MDTNIEAPANDVSTEAPVAAPVEKTPAPASEAPPGRVSVGDSIKAALEKSAKPDDASAGKPREPDGKFARKPETPAPVVADNAAPAPLSGVVEPPKATIKAPQSLKGELKAEWDKLDPKWQGEVDRLEREAVKKIQSTSQMANFGQTLHAEFAPYEALLRSSGATPQQALRQFLQTEYTLRTAPPAQKIAVAQRLLTHYGIDLSGVQPGQTPQIDPNVSALYQEVERMKQERQQEVTQRTNAESAQVNSDIDAFAADPKHPHFQEVRQHMGALMEAGAASSIGDAYDQACWANPSIREQLIREKQQATEAKRREDERKAVEAKKAASVSIRGTPATPIPAAVKGETVGQTIRRVAAQAQGRI